MSELEFTDADLLDLIAMIHDPDLPVDIESIQFCDVGVIDQSDPDLGIPERTGLVCRPVRGYTVNDMQLAIAEANNPNLMSGGDNVAYIFGDDIKAKDLKPTSVLAYRGKTYQIEYERAIVNRGKVLLHKLKLSQTQQQQGVTKADDPVLEFDSYNL